MRLVFLYVRSLEGLVACVKKLKCLFKKETHESQVGKARSAGQDLS